MTYTGVKYLLLKWPLYKELLYFKLYKAETLV